MLCLRNFKNFYLQNTQEYIYFLIYQFSKFWTILIYEKKKVANLQKLIHHQVRRAAAMEELGREERERERRRCVVRPGEGEKKVERNENIQIENYDYSKPSRFCFESEAQWNPHVFPLPL